MQYYILIDYSILYPKPSPWTPCSRRLPKPCRASAVGIGCDRPDFRTRSVSRLRAGPEEETDTRVQIAFVIQKTKPRPARPFSRGGDPLRGIR